MKISNPIVRVKSEDENAGGGSSGQQYLPFWLYFGGLIVCFWGELWRWGELGMGSSLHSHVLLIPFAAIYLLRLRKDELPRTVPSPFEGVTAGVVALAVLGLLWALGEREMTRGQVDRLSVTTLSFVGLVIAGAIGFLGVRWVQAAMFPLASLLFMVPLPDGLVAALEVGSQLASAEVADLLFGLSGVAYLRDEAMFQLPGITLRVAQECSGIRSSLVLLITGAYAANLLLRTTWRRWFLVLFVIPLGIVRNGFRILTIGLLCVHVGPHMADSWIHHRGGPVFFVLSLVPLLGLVWWLRRGENREPQMVKTEGSV